jgi:hypothetical protein
MYINQYSSALFRIPALSPPTINTLSFVNVDAVCPARTAFMFAVIVRIPVDGSYNSALFRSAPLNPPVTNTFHLLVWMLCAFAVQHSYFL